MYAFGVMANSGVRVSSMLLFVLVYCISLSNSADAGDKQMLDADFPSSIAEFFHNETLTEKQKTSIVTIELNCTVIDRENRTTVDSIYINVHKAILESLNRRMSDMTTMTPSKTPTSVTNPRGDGIVPNKKKRKKRQQAFNGDAIDAKDLRFVKLDHEFDENRILRMSLLLVLKESDKRDCRIILLEAANHANETGTLASETGVPVVIIYPGFPPNSNTMAMENYNHHYLIWPLVILFVILLCIVIGGFIYWKKKQDKLEVTGQRK